MVSGDVLEFRNGLFMLKRNGTPSTRLKANSPDIVLFGAKF